MAADHDIPVQALQQEKKGPGQFSSFSFDLVQQQQQERGAQEMIRAVTGRRLPEMKHSRSRRFYVEQ